MIRRFFSSLLQKHRPNSTAVIAAIALTVASFTHTSDGLAAPLLGGLAGTSAPATSGDDGSQWDAAKTQAALDDAKADLLLFENMANVTAGATPEEISKRRYFLRETVDSYQQQLKYLARLSPLSQQLAETRREVEAWQDFDVRPPYSVVFVDLLQQEVQSAEDKLKALKSKRETLREVRDRLSNALRSDAGIERLQDEKAQRSTVATTGASIWAVEQSRIKLRMLAAMTRSLTLVDRLSEIEMGSTQLNLKLAKAKLDRARGNVAFPEADFRKIQEELDIEARRIDRAITLAIDAGAQATGELETLNRNIAEAAARDLNAGGDAETIRKKVGALRDAASIAQLQSNNGDTLIYSLRMLPTILEIKRSAWDLRYRLKNKNSPELIREATETYQKHAGSIVLFAQYFEQQLASLVADTAGLQDRATSAQGEAQKALISRQLAIQLDREHQFREAQTAVSLAQEVVSRLGDDLGVERSALSLPDRFRIAAANSRDAAMSVWNYELFAVEQTIDVDGHKVTGISSVTIGKVVRAIFLFSFGVLIALWLGRIVERLLVHRIGYDAMRARIMRKWVFTLALAILLVSVLSWVNIPLTIFAFLGGAIAIGIGFGMQNVLKNLISGLMLLFERPFQPGDLIEVGTLKGTVTEIGIRSSIVRSVNGIDTLIPNSTFIEQNVTNWVHENPRVRFKVAIGVAYGTDVRQVAHLLVECASRHGLVMKDPAPEALLEDFGADALDFGLYYWVEIDANVSGNRVASDIRFIVEKTMNEHGIVIAYPQRDVHLDSAAPLKVEVVSSQPKT